MQNTGVMIQKLTDFLKYSLADYYCESTYKLLKVALVLFSQMA